MDLRVISLSEMIEVIVWVKPGKECKWMVYNNRGWSEEAWSTGNFYGKLSNWNEDIALYKNDKLKENNIWM
jgi:hypothetical protein